MMIGYKIIATGILCIMVALGACFWSVITRRVDGDAFKVTFGLLLIGGFAAVVIGAITAIWE